MKPFFFFYVCLSELQIKEQKDNGLVVGPWRDRKGLKTVLFPSCTTFSSGNKLWFPRSTAIHQGLTITHSWASLCSGPQVPIQWIWGLWATQKVLVGPTEGKRQGQWECSVPSDWWKKKNPSQSHTARTISSRTEVKGRVSTSGRHVSSFVQFQETETPAAPAVLVLDIYRASC